MGEAPKMDAGVGKLTMNLKTLLFGLALTAACAFGQTQRATNFIAANNITAGALTSGRVVFAGAGGILQGAAAFTFDSGTSTLSVTNVSVTQLTFTNLVGTVPVANGGTGITTGTSGGILGFTAAGTIASSGLLAANALMIGGGAGVLPSTVTTGANVLTALGIAIGNAGGVQLNNGSGAGLTLVDAATLGGATFAAPGAIGGGTPAAGAFTTISATGQFTSTLVTGTAPLVIASTTQVANLHAARAGTADILTTARTINGVSFDGSANITVTAAGSTLSDTVTVAKGGTGVASLTAYAPVFGGTTSTGAVQSGTAGTQGQVLVSNGTGVLPAFEALDLADADAVTGVLPNGNIATALSGKTYEGNTITTGTGTLTLAASKTLTATETTTLNRQSSTGLPVEFAVACSDMTTTLTTGTTKAYFRAPYAFTVTEVRASVNTPQTSGSLLTVDINDSGTTILSTKLTIDNNENTSTTAATPPVISDTAIADDAIIAVDIDTVGTGAVTGLIIWVKGYR